MLETSEALIDKSGNPAEVVVVGGGHCPCVTVHPDGTQLTAKLRHSPLVGLYAITRASPHPMVVVVVSVVTTLTFFETKLLFSFDSETWFWKSTVKFSMKLFLLPLSLKP